MKVEQRWRKNRKHEKERFKKRELEETVGSKSIEWRKYRKKNSPSIKIRYLNFTFILIFFTASDFLLNIKFIKHGCS